MLVALLHNAVACGAEAAERDVLVQAEAVAGALEGAGHRVVAVPCGLDLEDLRRRLEAARPHVVFNLVEALGGTDRLLVLVPLLVEALEIPTTGAPSAALLGAASKLAVKERLAAAGLPTPPWVELDRRGRPLAARFPGVPCIVKPVWEHASWGLEDDCVIRRDQGALEEVARCAVRLGRPCFAERFVEGREFNLSLLGRPGEPGCEVLPPAEIDFSRYPPARPRIVGQRAKWNASSLEYRRTPRTFEFPPSERPLLERLEVLARRSWELLGLRGYARVDFRVDRRGTPWILEVNPNPCLSPDAGFVAAAARAGLSWEDLVARIVAIAGAGSEDPVSARPA